MKIRKEEIPALMDYLGSFSGPGTGSAEIRNYLNFSMDRFLKTLELVPDDLDEKSRLLELGASPYFMSLLLKKKLGCAMDFGNYFGNVRKSGRREVLVSDAFGERHVMEYRHFNVERDRFPFRDKTYDLVLFCEIIEHLTEDPVHALVQINRVLKEGGYMMLTTPNVLRYENLMKLIVGANIHDHYSGYGAYGRHNREYTPTELRLLVEGMGFEALRLYTKVTGSMNIKGFSIKRFRRLIQLLTTRNRGGNIFLLARKTADSAPVYPSWLFESMHDAK